MERFAKFLAYFFLHRGSLSDKSNFQTITIIDHRTTGLLLSIYYAVHQLGSKAMAVFSEDEHEIQQYIDRQPHALHLDEAMAIPGTRLR